MFFTDTTKVSCLKMSIVMNVSAWVKTTINVLPKSAQNVIIPNIIRSIIIAIVCVRIAILEKNSAHLQECAWKKDSGVMELITAQMMKNTVQ